MSDPNSTISTGVIINYYDPCDEWVYLQADFINGSQRQLLCCNAQCYQMIWPNCLYSMCHIVQQLCYISLLGFCFTPYYTRPMQVVAGLIVPTCLHWSRYKYRPWHVRPPRWMVQGAFRFIAFISFIRISKWVRGSGVNNSILNISFESFRNFVFLLTPRQSIVDSLLKQYCRTSHNVFLAHMHTAYKLQKEMMKSRTQTASAASECPSVHHTCSCFSCMDLRFNCSRLLNTVTQTFQLSIWSKTFFTAHTICKDCDLFCRMSV